MPLQLFPETEQDPDVTRSRDNWGIVISYLGTARDGLVGFGSRVMGVLDAGTSTFMAPFGPGTNEVPRADFFGAAVFGGRLELVDEPGNSVVLGLAHEGKVVRLTAATAVNVTLAADLPKGWWCRVRRAGAGQPTVAPDAGATLFNSSGHTKIAAKGCTVVIETDDNPAGNNAAFIMSGETAA